MPYSYSKVEKYTTCPYQYKLRYIDKLKRVKSTDPTDARYLGTACHTGIETRSVEEAIENYKSNFDLLTAQHNIEILKLSTILPKAIAQVPEGEYEHKIEDGGFIGFIDCLVKVGEGVYDLLDFKYSNSASRYRKSKQVHVYKYFYEKVTGNTIRNMYYVMIPKFKDDEIPTTATDEEALAIIRSYFENKQITFEQVIYNQALVDEFFRNVSKMNNDTEFKKTPSPACKWCDYFLYCSTNGANTTGLEVEVDEPTIELVQLL